MRRLAQFAAVSVCISGCFFPADRGRVVESRLDGLTTDSKKLRAELEETRTKLEEATQQLQAALDQLDRASRTTGANIGVKVDSAMQDVAILRGQLETQQAKIDEIDSKLSRGGGMSAAAPSDDAKKDELARPTEPKPFLQLADEKAKAGEKDLAIKLYSEFMKKWPRDEAVGDAHFGLGEMYFQGQKVREALYEYGKVIQEHGKSKSAPIAYLRSADCFKLLKMNDEARLALEELMKAYPKSGEAKAAKIRLADMKKSGKK